MSDQKEIAQQICNEITYYLSNGGLFNPELANHEAVRDLLIRCRDCLHRMPKSNDR